MIDIALLLATVALFSPPKMSNPALNAWVVFDDNGASFESFKAHVDVLQSVSVDWLNCNAQGRVVRKEHPTPVERSILLSLAKTHGTQVYALVANDGFQARNVEAALASPEKIKSHVAALVKIAKEEGVDGIDLDYESLLAGDRDIFTKFVQEVSTAFHAVGLKVVIAVHPKESEPGNWDGPQAQDYAAIGKAVDKVRIMAYDLHWETSEAGPIAPLDWVTRVMSFSASVIPPNKLDMGIPAYGYDWVGKRGEDLTWDDWAKRVKAHGAAKRDPSSSEMELKYGDHTAFFGDAESARSKIALAQKLGLNGLAMWRLGSEDPAFWQLYKKLAK